MYSEVPLYVALALTIGGLAALAWSSDVFVDGAARLAKLFGISPFVIGMVVIGFGTSAPELCVSALSGISGHSNLSLGNAYGSCIFNVMGILGVAALIRPIAVKPRLALLDAPALTAISLSMYFFLSDGGLSRVDSLCLLAMFAVIMPAYCFLDRKPKSSEAPATAEKERGGAGKAAVKIFIGLAVLVGSSHCLVWGAVDLARSAGVDELLIGLTVVAVGTSLPELASAIASARRGENEFVLGNIIGSNIFNTLAVVGIAGALCPIEKFSPYILTRDLPIMAASTFIIALFSLNWKNRGEPGRINRLEGAMWVTMFVLYTALMIYQEVN